MTTTTTRGDAIPGVLQSYYESLDAGRHDAAAESFSTDATYAVPAPNEIETGPRSIVNGRDAIIERFVARGTAPWVHDVLLCVTDGRDVFVEGVTRDRSNGGEPTSSFAASAQLNESGLIERYLVYTCTPPVPRSAVAANPSDESPFDAMAKIHEYFDALDTGRFADAAACFSDTTLYSHPPYKDPSIGGPGRANFEGRASLEAAFHRRGIQRIDHLIVANHQRGPHLLLEGIVNDADGNLVGTFVSSATLDVEGLIDRYVAFYCQPGVPRR